MYFDFVKYKYDDIEENERCKYIERDKKGYKKVLLKWIDENIEDFVERKWQINDIFYLKEISDFLKPLREAENLYEFGFYTACISLIGVSSEDFSKYLVLEKLLINNDNYTQKQRLIELRDRCILTDNNYNRLNEIRIIRNDCLHFNQRFKQKDNEDLNKDAINSLNNLKYVISEMYGVNKEVTLEEYTEIMNITLNSECTSNTKNFDDYVFRNRNAISHLLSIGLAQHPDKKYNVRVGLFSVNKIDLEYEEVDLIDLRIRIPVCVDLTNQFKNQLIKNSIKENDIIFACVFSEINDIGLSAFWHFKFFRKI